MSNEATPTPTPSPDAGALRIALAMIAVLCALFGGAFLYAYRQTAVAGRGIVITQPSAPSPEPTISVHVAGAVGAPGLYTLARGARAGDALAAAGGPTPDADQDALNLAAQVADGDQLLVPKRVPPVAEPSAKPKSSAVTSRSATQKLKSPGDGMVNINTAAVNDLQRLPGIGPAMAARILAYRKEIGRFTSVEQLLDVSGIGEKKLAQMKPFVRIR